MNNIDDGKLHRRKERIFFFYRDYLLADILDDSNESINGEEYSFTKKQKDFIKIALKKKSFLEEEIFKYLPKDWKWERFNVIEKAILFNASAEILLMNNSKSIVINESVNFAKIYCCEKAQPLMNAIIDKFEYKEK